MVGHDPQHTGQSEYLGAQRNALKWTADTGGYILSSPAVDSRGTAYVVSGNNRVVAVPPDGSIGWTASIGGYGGVYDRFGAAVGPDGTVYVSLLYRDEGGMKPTLLALYPDGNERWRWQPECTTDVTGPPTVDHSGSIYLATGCGLFALSSDGRETWTAGAPLGNRAPTVAQDGTLYLAGGLYTSACLWAMESGTGAPRWQACWTSPVDGYVIVGDETVVDASGTIVVPGSYYDSGWVSQVRAFLPTGDPKWTFTDRSGGFVNSVSAADDGTIYAAGLAVLYAIGPDGSENWRFSPGGSLQNKPAIGADGTLYLVSARYEAGGYRKTLHAVGKDGAEKWQLELGTEGFGYHYPEASIGPDGTVLIGFTGTLYAVGPGPTPTPTATPAATPTVTPAIPSEVLSPILGDLETVSSLEECHNTKWCFNQHGSCDGGIGHCVGGGVCQADDTYAWDANLNTPTPDSDAGMPVHAVAEGFVAETYAECTNGDDGSSGQLLIRHDLGGIIWWSGYLHMSNILVTPGTHVYANSLLGYISDKGATNKHLHFVVYTGENTRGSLVSFDARIVPRLGSTSLIAAAAAGDTELQVGSLEGFAPGDLVRINPGGPNAEDSWIASMGSLILASPLRFPHQVDEPIVKIPNPAVGGIAELPAIDTAPAQQAAAPSVASHPSAAKAPALAGGLAAALLAMTTAAWYARRRWLR
jgi:hypothetical protein